MPFIAVASTVAKPLISFGLSKLFGGKKKKTTAPLPKFDAGGLRGMGSTISSTPARQGLVSGISQTFPKQAKFTQGLLDEVRPGFGRLTQSRLREVENARNRAVGNLKNNLSNRRIAGSSFGQNALIQAEREFADKSEQVAASSFLQELDLTRQLAKEKFEAGRNEFLTQLNELDFQASIAKGLSAQSSQILMQNAALNAKSSAGAGQFFGQQVIGPLGNAISGGFGPDGGISNALGSSVGFDPFGF